MIHFCSLALSVIAVTTPQLGFLLLSCCATVMLNVMLLGVWQCNSNQISCWDSVSHLEPLKVLQTVYFEHNPIWADSSNPHQINPSYRRKVMLILPWVKQIDATYCRWRWMSSVMWCVWCRIVTLLSRDVKSLSCMLSCQTQLHTSRSDEYDTDVCCKFWLLNLHRFAYWQRRVRMLLSMYIQSLLCVIRAVVFIWQ